MMVVGLRSKAVCDPLKDDEKLDAKLALASMLTSALKEQQSFIEAQFAKFED